VPAKRVTPEFSNLSLYHTSVQFNAQYALLAFPGKIDDLLSNGLEPNMTPPQLLRQKMEIAVGLVYDRSTAALVNPLLFEHQSKLRVSGEGKQPDKSGSECGEWSFREANASVAAADHSVASN